MLANYCPYEQELAYRNSHRDSRCSRADNQPSSNYEERLSKACRQASRTRVRLKMMKTMHWKIIRLNRNVSITAQHGNNILINAVENVDSCRKQLAAIESVR
jgi:hypothetical protein